MKHRKITALWVEVDLKGYPRVYVMRTRTSMEWSQLPRAYTPTSSSLKRINSLARNLSRSTLPFTCEISNEPDILMGWSLIREERLYIPPQELA
jgi:hypothetical protein